MRIAFLGTPDFAVPALDALYNAGHTLLVVTQPDKKQGRKQVLTPPPVKAYALANDIPVAQFEKIKNSEGVAALRDFAPELIITAAYGQILSREILDIPKYGCLNIHASLLPEYRGAAPIQQAILDGKSITGVTIMLMAEGLDTGDIISFRQTDIDPFENTSELTKRLSLIGAKLLMETIDPWVWGKITPVPQDNEKASRCRPITREMAKLDFSRSAKALHDLVRAMDPWPGAYASLACETVKIWKTRVPDNASTKRDVPFGARVDLKTKGLFINTGDGILEILEIQPQNGKRMDARSFLNGKAGARLTEDGLT